MKILENFFKRFDGLHQIALLLAIMTITSYVVSIIRDRLFVAELGASTQLDLYVSSFKIPDTFFIMFIALASVYSLLPSIERAAAKGEKNEKEFLDTFFYIFSIILMIGAILLFIFIPFLTKIIFNGFAEADIIKLIFFSKLLIFQVFLLSVSNFFSAIIQHERRFLIYALTPIMYNLGIIFGVLVFYPVFGDVGLTVGVIFGAFLHLAIQIPYLLKAKKLPIIKPVKSQIQNVYTTMIVSIPRSLALTANNISILLIFGLITVLGEGIVSVFYLAGNLSQIPLALIGISYSIASFPILTKSHTLKDKKTFNDTVESSLCSINILIIPILVALIVSSKFLIESLFSVGLFSQQETLFTSWVFTAILFSSYGKAILSHAARAFYSARKTFQPVIIFIFVALFEVSSVYLILKSGKLTTFLNSITGKFATTGTFEEVTLVSISLSITIISLIAAFFVIHLLKHYFGINIKRFVQSLVHSILATIIFIFVFYVLMNIFIGAFESVFWVLFVLGVSGLIALVPWALILNFLQNKEFLLLKEYLIKKYNL